MLAVGGRDTLSLVEVNFKDEKFSIKKNLRKIKLDFPRQNTVYLEWNPNDYNLLASAALGGFISVWDVNQGTNASLNKAFMTHNQAINKINWHPKEPNCLVSGSHDCTVKIWELKETSEPACIIKLNSSVRDVKFVPTNSDYLVCALESGGLELYDRRYYNKAVSSSPNAHRKAILTMDFNQMKPNLLATGSIDKEIKIWDITNIEKELYKLKYLAGVGFAKWKPDDEEMICVSSYSGDNSLSLWNTSKKNYPIGLLRGHKDVVTACVYESKLNYIITASKDGYVICHPGEGVYNPMNYCNKYGLSFDSDSTLAFTFNDRKPKAQKKSTRNVCLVSKLNYFLGSKFTTMKDEINYYSERYKRTREDPHETCEYNSEASRDKRFVSKIWKDIPMALKEMTAERDNPNPSSMNFAQFLKVNSRVYDQDNSPIASKDSKSSKNLLTNHDLNHLIGYYEKHPEQFKSDWNEKQIVIKDGIIYIKPQYINDVLRMIAESNKSLERTDSKQQDVKKIEKLTFDSIIKTVQELVNVGELQSAYFIYLVLHEKIPFPESSVKVWAQSYIELLRTYQFYQESNEIIKSCPLSIISDGNKKSTTFLARCGKCRKITESDSEYICSNCKDFISVCTICKLPVKGLMLWCQVCGHGGHYKEVYEWFLNNSECASGCSHKCFNIRNKSNIK